MIIGLAGKSCSGKNRLARHMEEMGAIHLDLDRLNHRLLEENRMGLVRIFGESILDGRGSLNRQALSSLVFGNRGELEKLEKFIHPLIEGETEKTILSSRGKIVLLNGAVLHKSALAQRLDGVIWMHSPPVLRFYRALRRDNRGIINLMKRFLSQRKFSAQQFPSHVDIYKVYNGFFDGPLKRKARILFNRLSEKENIGNGR